MRDISVVVPVLNEITSLHSQLDHLELVQKACRELIFVDGGSSDGSLEFLLEHFTEVFQAPAGRAMQMNSGAKIARGQSILFLHVDTVLPLNNLDEDLLNATWGFFQVRLSGRQGIYRLIEKGINFRARVFKVGTGDQCLFFNRERFLSSGGFREQRLMEDIEISRYFKRRAAPFIVRVPVTTSSRRWEKHGVFKTVLLMWSLQLLYKLGVSAERLAIWYGYEAPVQNDIGEKSKENKSN